MHDNPRHTVLSSLEPETKQTSRFNPIQFHELVTLKRLQTPQFPTIHNKSAIHLLWVCHGGQQLSLSLLPNLPLPSCPIWQGVEGYPFQLPDHHISSLSVLSGQELKDSASSYLTTILPASLIWPRVEGYSDCTYLVFCHTRAVCSAGGLEQYTWTKKRVKQKTKVCGMTPTNVVGLKGSRNLCLPSLFLLS